MGNIEAIEPRRLLAVTAFTTEDNTLIVRGDDAANDVTIGFDVGRGRTFIYADGLLVNGQPADGRFFFNKAILDIALDVGDDTLRLNGGSYTVAGPEARFGTSTIRMGDGDDRVIWADGGFDALTVDLGAGDDRLSGAAFRIRGQLTLLGGAGRDRFGLQNADFINALVLNDRSGPTIFEAANNAVGGIAIQTGHSADRVTVTGGTLTGVFGVVTRGGDDTITLTDYLQPSDQRHNVVAGGGANAVIDSPRRRPKPTGRLDVTLEGTTLDLVGTGGLNVDLSPRFGSSEETLGEAITTDGLLFINGVYKPTRSALFGRDTPVRFVRIRLDGTNQRVTIDAEGLSHDNALDIATGDGNDEINLRYYSSKTVGINAGAGDDRVNIASYADKTVVNLGLGRDRLTMNAPSAGQVSVIDPGGPAFVSIRETTITAVLSVQTSDAIDRITLADMTVNNLFIRTNGGTDVLTEEDVKADDRNVDLGVQ